MRIAQLLLALLCVSGLLASAAQAQRAFGIDVSHFQNAMNWNTAYDQGVRFAFVRATRGPSTGVAFLNDTQFSNNVAGLHDLAVNQNKTIYNGFYHFARPDLIAINDGNNSLSGGNRFNSQPTQATILSSAADEAQHFYDVIGPHLSLGGPDATRRLRPVMDLERFGGPTTATDPGIDSGRDQLTAANVSLWTLTFLNTFETLSGGIRPLIYMSASPAGTNVNSTLSSEDLWVAQWNNNPNSNPNTGVFSSWAFHQYSSAGNDLGDEFGASVPEDADLDLNVANGDINFVRTFLIPEPTGLAPLLAGGALLLGRRRRRAA